MGSSHLEVAQLVSQLRDADSRFRQGNNGKLLDVFVQCYPKAPSQEELRIALNAHAPDVPVSRFRKRLLEAYRKHRELWGTQQILFMPTQDERPEPALEVRPLSEILSPSMTFWFHQCVNLPPGEGEPFIVLSEPLFFLCPATGAYLRFLDVNYDDAFDDALKGNDSSAKLLEWATNEAKERLLQAFPAHINLDEQHRQQIRQGINLIPVRLYLPAGDSYAKTEIRRWFRKRMDHFLAYKQALSVPIDHYTRSSLIVLASRSSLPLLDRFQKRETHLKIHLTSDGIRFMDQDLRDEVGKDGTVSLARVVVTQWVLDTQSVHTYIASNNTRAVEAVARTLVDDNSTVLKELSQQLTASRPIPQRFQVAFEVALKMHETHANPPKLLPELHGRPIVYE
jgi:hypothetical protein